VIPSVRAMDYFQLKGKTALVTGSTSGIGFATAQVLAKAGANVIVNGRSQKSVDEAVRKIKESVTLTGTLESVTGDVATKEGCDFVTGKVPHVDILINNVGVFKAIEFAKTTDKDWEDHFQINVMSGVRLSRFYFGKMVEKKWGRIIFISSEAGLVTPPEMIHYGMTKTAQIAVARGLAELTVGTGVTVNTVLPGPTLTEGIHVWLADRAKQENKTVEQVTTQMFTEGARASSLIKRFLDPLEIANTVLFVASPLSSGTNGATIKAEGGIVKSF